MIVRIATSSLGLLKKKKKKSKIDQILIFQIKLGTCIILLVFWFDFIIKFNSSIRSNKLDKGDARLNIDIIF